MYGGGLYRPIRGAAPPDDLYRPIRGAPLPVSALRIIGIPIDAKIVPRLLPTCRAVGRIVKSLAVSQALSKSRFCFSFNDCL